MSDKWQMPWALPLGSREDGCRGEAVQAEPEPERRVCGAGGREGAGAPGGGVTWQEEAPLGSRGSAAWAGERDRRPDAWPMESCVRATPRSSRCRAGAGKPQAARSPRGHDERAPRSPPG